MTGISYPDGTSYSFTYEATPATRATTRAGASVTLPTGGVISYAYSGSNNGITCADGSTATLTRTTPDGTWSYAHSESGTAWTTVQTDPQGNVTDLYFQGIYEVERKVYQGSGTLLVTRDTCYNASASPCLATAVGTPITQIAAQTTLPGSANLKSKVATSYNSYGLATETDEYDFGSGAVGTPRERPSRPTTRRLATGSMTIRPPCRSRPAPAPLCRRPTTPMTKPG